MLLPRKQLLKFRRLNRKLNTSPDYFRANYKRIIKKTKFLLVPHYVIRCQVKRTKRKVILHFNHLQVYGDRRIRLKKERVNLRTVLGLPSEAPKRKKCSKRHRGKSLSQKLRKPVVANRLAQAEIVEIDDDDDDDVLFVEEKEPVATVNTIVGDVSDSVAVPDILPKVTPNDAIEVVANVVQGSDKTCDKNIIVPQHNSTNIDVNKNRSIDDNDSSGDDTTTSESESDNDDDDEEKETEIPANKLGSSAEKPKDTVQPTEDVTKKIREQIKLLQSGKRDVALLAAGKNSFTDGYSSKTSSRCVSPAFSRHASHSSIEDGNTSVPVDESNKIASDTPLNAQTAMPSATSTPLGDRKRFLDLLNKIHASSGRTKTDKNSNRVTDSPAATVPAKENAISRIAAAAANDKTERSIDDEENSSDDFLGFPENDIPADLPGLLATPIVRNASRNIHSAFVSAKCDALMKELAIDTANSAPIVPAKKFVDEALVSQEAQPPTLVCPQLPTTMEKPRTVAEKRQLLARQQQNVKYLMIENESTVYRELSKRAKNPENINYEMVKAIQDIDIPFTRDCWRATCWLNTQIGNFYYQTIDYNRNEVKIISGKGDNAVKTIAEIQNKSSMSKRVRRVPLNDGECSEKCKINHSLRFGGLDALPLIKFEPMGSSPVGSPAKVKKLNPFNECALLTAAPLSRKQLKKPSMDIELGPLEVYNMPLIQLEVWPEIDKPLPDIVLPYLKMALPYECITENWAKFAVSTVVVKQPKQRNKRKRKVQKPIKIKPEPFSFDIPYINNQDKILVRKRKDFLVSEKALDASLLEIDDKPFTFLKNVKANDEVGIEVANVLGKMINSVAISLSENSFIHEDRMERRGRKRKVKRDTSMDKAESELSAVNAERDERKRLSLL